MPFFLYRIEANEYIKLRRISLAGGNGPFCRAATANDDDPEWELSERSLLGSCGVAPERHALIIDLKPRDAKKVHLYRVKHVWGYDSHGWCPLAVELEGLYVEVDPPAGISAGSFKERFALLSGAGDRIYEFLYLKDNWGFGPVGSVNAALLWDSPDVRTFDSFLKRINRKRQDVDRLPLLGTV